MTVQLSCGEGPHCVRGARDQPGKPHLDPVPRTRSFLPIRSLTVGVQTIMEAREVAIIATGGYEGALAMRKVVKGP